MKANKLYLSLIVEYTDKSEVIEALQLIIKQVKHGRVKYNRDKCNSAIFEWAIDYVDPEYYSEEVIDGKLCLVYQSKMNKK